MSQKARQEIREGLKRLAEARLEPPMKYPLRRADKKKDAVPLKIIAYDFETTRIQQGTPRPLYITSYSEDIPTHYASPIESMQHLQNILVNQFLTEENLNATFCAWNANNFDSYFVAVSLVTSFDFCMVPFLTRSNALRGLRIIRREDIGKEKVDGWQFLDGIAMLGLVGTPLSKFTENFAPNHKKMTGVIDFEKEEFDSKNPLHCQYAMQDSIGLYHAMKKAQDIMVEHFNQSLAVTMGGACIKIFKAHIPKQITIAPPDDELMNVIREYVMRGGFCYCVKRYEGPVWKYDLNQAYAAAMREAKLPCGFPFNTKDKLHRHAETYIVKISAYKPDNKIPFYCRIEDLKGKIRSTFAMSEIKESWITSIEHEQLIAEGWQIEIHESWTWPEKFNMKEYVDKLEFGRMNAEGGPSGPQGTMYKNVGNHSYGKTVEQLEAVEYVISNECPEGYVPFYADDEADPLDHVFYRFLNEEEIREKDYHQPQIGSFITAFVRMVVRRGALLAPDNWLYADTDCIVFNVDITSRLDVHAKRYGAWKIEEEGAIYQIIAKKVYTKVGAEKGHAKGMNVKKLTPEHFEMWFDGVPPAQRQIQRNNFLEVLKGAEMYRSQLRHGTSVEKTT